MVAEIGLQFVFSLIPPNGGGRIWPNHLNCRDQGLFLLGCHNRWNHFKSNRASRRKETEHRVDRSTLMADEETGSPIVEQPPVAEKEAQPVEPEEKKEEKPKASREKKPRKPKTAAHPPYFQMIKEALLALNEKSGSSPYAIAKYMEENHKSVLPVNFRKTLALQLKNSAAKGKLVKIRASYKLSETRKMARSPMATRQRKLQQETKTRRTTRSSSKRAKTMSVNKPEVATKKKRSGAKKKAKPRQPKSIKFPVSKKAMKASAS